jgi:hypothetical protein
LKPSNDPRSIFTHQLAVYIGSTETAKFTTEERPTKTCLTFSILPDAQGYLTSR